MLWKIDWTASQVKIVYEKVQFLFGRYCNCLCNLHECFLSEEKGATTAASSSKDQFNDSKKTGAPTKNWDRNPGKTVASAAAASIQKKETVYIK